MIYCSWCIYLLDSEHRKQKLRVDIGYEGFLVNVNTVINNRHF